ncbi:hypothetical protein ACSAZL_02110 [Methanosarcina sp. T3]|uniref:hypothetical protein n=1 Tax=Methanosarcina sp. T3 TaxID=3439062 RepID=UPI003F86DA2E
MDGPAELSGVSGKLLLAISLYSDCRRPCIAGDEQNTGKEWRELKCSSVLYIQMSNTATKQLA